MTGLPFTIEALEGPSQCTCGESAATHILHFKFQNEDKRLRLCDSCGIKFISMLQAETPAQVSGVTPLFGWSKLDGDHACAASCGRPASYLITMLKTKNSYVYCGPCMVGFFLEYAKAEGIDVETICLGFPELSKRLEKPLGSTLVQ